jgi:hypothetical protein
MDSQYIKNIARLWQEVVEGKKKLDPVNKKALAKDFDDRKDKDIDNDGDIDSSDEYLHKRRKAITKSMKEADDKMKSCPKCDGSMDNHDAECPYDDDDDDMDESNDVSTKSVDKALTHDCAKHVTSEAHGFGECISGQHTLVENEDGSATVTHYDVMFEHGVEFNVPVEELEILVSESHKHTAKKKVSEAAVQAKQVAGGGEKYDSKESGKAKEFAKLHDIDSPEVPKGGEDSLGHEDATKAGRITKKAPVRGGESKIGDTAIVKPVKGAVLKTTGRE